MTFAPLATPIAALPGDDSARAQEVLRLFARSLTQEGMRVAGVTQIRVGEGGRARVALRDLVTGQDYPISQDLGPGSVACNLDAGELALACAAIERAAQDGAALIIISKFAKQEAARGGLRDAFRAAMSAHIPVATAVSPHFRAQWRVFSGPLAEDVAADVEALRAWFARIS
ncbi:MAG: DUF2478 domain-containing protein [Methylocystis sp.]|nr:DUF2478 domain-containing protein [Methylocystis sp.]